LLIVDLLYTSCICGNLKDYPRNCISKLSDLQMQPLNNISAGLPITSQDTTVLIAFNNLALDTRLIIENITCAYNKKPSGFIINTVQACKPAIINISNLSDSIASISVKSLRPYNANYGSGANVNNILIHEDLDPETNLTTSNLTTADLITKHNAKRANLSDVYALTHTTKLIEKPSASGDTVQFAIAVSLSNGAILHDTTCNMVLSF
jgi:hypothetical protein